MSIQLLQAMIQLSIYFNNGDGQNADQKTKDSFIAIRDFFTAMIGEAMREDKSQHA